MKEANVYVEYIQILGHHGVGLAILAMAFSRAIRKEVRRRQSGICDRCGENDFLQVHHRIPESLNGSEDITNAVGVCRKCHRELDREAFMGFIYHQVHDEDGYYPTEGVL